MSEQTLSTHSLSSFLRNHRRYTGNRRFEDDADAMDDPRVRVSRHQNIDYLWDPSFEDMSDSDSVQDRNLLSAERNDRYFLRALALYMSSEGVVSPNGGNQTKAIDDVHGEDGGAESNASDVVVQEELDVVGLLKSDAKEG